MAALLLTAVCLSLAVEVRAQDTTSLKITVVDQTGGPVPGALVTVERAGTVQSASPSGTPGVYEIAGLTAGRYAVAVALDGFTPVRREVDISPPRSADLRIVVALQISETVDVTTLQLGTRSGLTGLVLSGKDLDLLPTNEIEMLHRLLELAGSRGRPGDVAIYVDGFRDFRRLPPRSAIEAIQINAEPYSAEFSEPGTRRIEVITRPGTDGVFGELKSEFNDEAANAREPLASSKPPLQRVSASGYFSAPIIRSRWGLYAYAGTWEQDENAVINAMSLDGDFNAMPIQATLAAPMHLNNYTLNTGIAVGRGARIKAEYSRDDVYARNQGLKDGFSLPERAVSVDNRVETARLSLLTVFSPKALFEVRGQHRDERTLMRSAGNATGIQVFEAFNAGANQAALHNEKRSRILEADAKLTLSFGKHTTKLGAVGTRRQIAHVDQAYAAGAFTFGSGVERDETGAPIRTDDGVELPISPLENYRRALLGLKGYTPTQFAIRLGDPLTALEQLELGGFLQHDWVPSEDFTLSLGVRYEQQNNLRDDDNYAPRVGIAWEPWEGAGIIRGGIGIFHGRIEPDITLDTLRLDGTRQTQIVIENPTFFPAIPQIDASLATPTIMRKAETLSAPELYIANASYERALHRAVFGSISYIRERGVRVPRLVDINAPVTLGERPQPRLGPVLEFASVGRSEREELQLGLRVSLGEGSRLLANYVLSTTEGDSDTPRTLPADSRFLENEFAPTTLHERHRVFVSGTVSLPGLWLIVPSLSAASPRPFNIVTGFDNNGDTHLTDRPAFAEPSEPGAILTPFGAFDPTPEPGDIILPRNYGYGVRTVKLDLSVSKIMILDDPNSAKRTLTFSVSVENLLNNANLKEFNGVLLSPVFSLPSAADPARRVSVSTTVTF